VPAIRAIDAIWTGGTTTVVVDPLRVIQDCRERAGKRVPAEGGDPEVSNTIVFEARSDDSVADFVFRQTLPQAACRIVGRLLVGPMAVRLECQLTGVGGRGAARELRIDLPPTWVPDRVRWNGTDEPLAWHPSIRADGSTRLHVLLPGIESIPLGRVLEISASSTAPGGQGPLILPRVHPSDLPIGDEMWVAIADPSMTLTPISAEGLVWIDPSKIEKNTGSSSDSSPDLYPALAWRWNAEGARALVNRQQAEQKPRAEIQYYSRIEQNGKSLAVEGRILIKLGTSPPMVLPVWISQPADGSQDWSFQFGTEARELDRLPADQTTRSSFDFPATGQVWNLPIDAPASGETQIRFKTRIPWNRVGPIPLISLPRVFLPRSTILIEIPQQMRADVQAAGLRRLDLSIAERLAASWRRDRQPDQSVGAAEERGYQLAHAFTLTEPGGRLELTTEELSENREAAPIRDACLTTVLHPSGPWLNRLRLFLRAEKPVDLSFTMPAQTRLVRVQLGGVDVTPTLAEGRMVVSIAPAGPGLKYKSVDLDYETRGGNFRAGAEFGPVLPWVEMSCLSFCWELLTPPRWLAGSPGPGLVPHDPGPTSKWPFGPLGFPPIGWAGRQPSARRPSDEAFRRLDEALTSAPSEELSFAGWFARWDSDTTPLLIDRLALGSDGRGPRSRCVPIRVDPGGQSVSVKTLQKYGLALLRLDHGLVITSQSEAPRFDEADYWERAMGEALLWGSDRFDRLQTTSRWRGEITIGDTTGNVSAQPLRAPPGWTTWRFTGGTWPGEASRVVLSEERADMIAAWTIALLVILGVGSWRCASPRRVFLVLIAMLLVSILIHLWQTDDRASLSAGLFVGAMASLLHRLGIEVAARCRASPVAARSGMTDVRRFALRARPTTVFLTAFLIAHAQAVAGRDQEPPIPVLMPYEGMYDPGADPQQVILRESDYQRLQEIAKPRQQPNQESMFLTKAIHQVSRSGNREICLVSDLEIRSTLSAASTWKVPITGAHDITAALDGSEVPVFLESGGRQAAVRIPGGGSFKLQVRRTVTLTTDPLGTSLDFPVNPVPTARLIIDLPSRIGLPRFSNARGRPTGFRDQSTAADLGPVDHVEIRWGDDDASASQVPGAVIESLVLWDIEPAGDRLRCRFTYHGPRRLSTLSFLIDPGLKTRSLEIPGLINFSWAGTVERPILTTRMDPPLQDGAILALDLWRPAALSKGDQRRKFSEDPPPGETTRRFPGIEPLGVERYSGLLGLRRPGYWTGRLQAPMGTESVSDELFVKSWGTLPDDRLTLSGTTRLDRNLIPSLRTGRAAIRIKVKPVLELAIDAGRIDARFEADLDDAAGALNRVELVVPRELVVLSVESDALTGWSRPDPGQLLLRYDRPFSRSRRRLRISGWVPILESPLKIGSQQLQVPTPWLELSDMETTSATLIIDSPFRVQVSSAPGLKALPGGSARASDSTDERVHLTYQVENSGKLGVLEWSTAPPSVKVLIDSQITLHQDSAEWVAILRYGVSSGALDSIHLKLPAAWAAKAQVELGGGEFRIKADLIGPSVFWTLKPKRPVWGSQRIVLRSELSLMASQELQLPEIVPLGPGFADTYLGLVYPQGSALSTAGSTGLREISYANRFKDEEFGEFPGTISRAFHVERANWSWKVQIPSSSEEGFGAAKDFARVVSADVNMVMLPDHSLQGRAVYDIQAHTGSFFVAELPPDSALLWTTVDQKSASAFRSADGRWFIPLGEQQGPCRVNLLWRDKSPILGSNGADWFFVLPRAGEGRVSAVATLHLPNEMMTKPRLAGLELTSPDRVELERADRIARQLAAFLVQIDRSSGRDRERVAALLVEHEMSLRRAETAIRRIARGSDRTQKVHAELDLGVIRSSRTALSESFRAAGMSAEIDAAWNYFGLPRKGFNGPLLAMPEPVGPDCLRNLGKATFFIGLSAGLNEQPTRISGSLENAGSVENDTPLRARWILVLGLTLVLGFIAAASRRPAITDSLILICLLGMLGLVGGPVAVAAGLVLLFAGWASWRGHGTGAATPSPPAGLYSQG
jgi:hypothetical protein